MINVKQFTNFDDLPIEGDYKVITLPAPAFKLGYCGDSFSVGKTIILTINGKQEYFSIGETGIFEYENYKIENSDGQEIDRKIYTTEVRVPADVNFTLDYFIE